MLGDGFPFLEASGEGVAMEPEAAGEVGSEIPEVEDSVDLGVKGWPDVVLEPLSDALAAGEGEGLFSSDTSPDVQKELEGVGERLGEFFQVTLPTCEDENVISKDSGSHIGGAGFQDPWACEEREDHHAERASLGDSFGMVVWFADVASEAVIDDQIFDT